MINKTIQTYRKIYKDYSSRNVMNNDISEMLNLFISKLSGKSVLDIGCAQGRESTYMSQRGLDVTGIDLTPEFIELAKQNCTGCAFKVMDMCKLDFPDSKFDGIWACASFLHIPKEKNFETLCGFHKVLKNSGILYLSVMEGEFDSERENTDLKWEARHFSDYKEEELRELLTKAGFKVKEIIRKKTSSGRVFIHTFSLKN